MADELDGLLARVDDAALRADLRTHIDRLRSKRSFGLVFESHLPERVRLPEHPVRVGASVALRDDPKSATYEVLGVESGRAAVRTVRHPDGSRLSPEEQAESVVEAHPLEDLVVISDFGDPIYPGPVSYTHLQQPSSRMPSSRRNRRDTVLVALSTIRGVPSGPMAMV